MLNQEVQRNFTLKLYEVFRGIQMKLNDEGYQELKLPNIEISQTMNSNLGEWIADENKIRISAGLFTTQPFSVIRDIFRHEVAHMIVSVLFRCYNEKPHGEAFCRACELVDADPGRVFDETELNLDPVSEKIKEKVQKILKKAECAATTEEETELFLEKAQEMMLKYNISESSLNDDRNSFITLPIGSGFLKRPSYIGSLCKILEDFYFVKYITISLPERPMDAEEYDVRFKKHIELYGTKSNVEIAAYVYDVLLRESEKLWNSFKKKMKKQGIPIRGYYTKSSYIRGVMKGFREKLEAQKNEFKTEHRNYSLILKKDAEVLNRNYLEEYPNLVVSKTTYTISGGYEDGREAGKNLEISDGVSAPKNKMLLH